MGIANTVHIEKYKDDNDVPSNYSQDIGGDTTGEAWEEEDLSMRFPKLCKKFNFVL